MEQTALRPKPLPGHESGPGPTPAKEPRRPHAAHRRGRRLVTLLFGLLCAAVLVLSGVGLGTVGATVIGMSKLAEMQRQAGEQGAAPPGGPAPGQAQVPGQAPPGAAKEPGKGPGAAPGAVPGAGRPDQKASAGQGAAAVGPRAAPRPALGVEAVDAPRGSGALVVGVHQPGPGHAAGLVRGDVLVAFGGTRVRSAGDLAKAVADARPGRNVMLTVRHASGARQVLSARPGLVT
ncbi:PDZ domain-containing protein [Streptomyces aureoverticillatus]|nr:PDZ domain-containing protein [Streptomyces aureoverticillatus]